MVDYVNKTNLPASLKNHQGMANTKVWIFFGTQLYKKEKCVDYMGVRDSIERK